MQLELFGPCIFGRKRKSEAERLLDCERRAEALGLRVVILTGDMYADAEVDLGVGPYGIIDPGTGYPWPFVGMDAPALEEELSWFESQREDEDDPGPDGRPRKALLRRAAA